MAISPPEIFEGPTLLGCDKASPDMAAPSRVSPNLKLHNLARAAQPGPPTYTEGQALDGC